MQSICVALMDFEEATTSEESRLGEWGLRQEWGNLIMERLQVRMRSQVTDRSTVQE